MYRDTNHAESNATLIPVLVARITQLFTQQINKKNVCNRLTDIAQLNSAHARTSDAVTCICLPSHSDKNEIRRCHMKTTLPLPKCTEEILEFK